MAKVLRGSQLKALTTTVHTLVHTFCGCAQHLCSSKASVRGQSVVDQVSTSPLCVFLTIQRLFLGDPRRDIRDGGKG